MSPQITRLTTLSILFFLSLVVLPGCFWKSVEDMTVPELLKALTDEGDNKASGTPRSGDALREKSKD